jgi:peroxiredoxin
MMKKYLPLVLLLIIAVNAYGNPNRIDINGIFPGAEGKEIRLFEYEDMISYREKEVASAVVDVNGRFQLTFNRRFPQYAFFRIDHARMGFFIQPGNSYILQFDRVDFNGLNDKINPYLNPWHFNYTITTPANSLHANIEELDDVLNTYMTANFNQIQRNRNRNAFQEIKNRTDSLYGKIENPFFKDYYKYIYGYYNHITNTQRPLEIMRNYILNQEVLYHNPQYMNLFNTVFDTYIFAGSRTISLSDLRHTINTLNSYNALMDSLGKDTLLRNEVIRELVMLKGLQDMHGNPDYHKANVENILSHVVSNSKFPQHRVIARNILYQKRYLAAGTPAPSFTLIDDDGKTIKFPEDFRGKYVYIGFWTSWCETCMLDFVALREMRTKFGDDVMFLGVSTDRHLADYQRFIRSQNPPGKNLYFQQNFRLTDAYQVRSLPTYILLDREGKVVNYPARRPSDDIISLLERLLHQERRSIRR